jgi:glycosyltransferase involved in cell wall biosynthesis
LSTGPHKSEVTGTRVVHLVNRLGSGGAQRVAAMIASNWPESAGTSMIVTALDGPYRAEVARATALQVLAPGWPAWHAKALFCLRLSRLVAREGIDVLVSYVFGMTQLALLLRWLGLLRCEVVVVEQNHLSSVLRSRYGSSVRHQLIDRASRFLYRNARLIIGSSDGVARDLEQFLSRPEGSIPVIENPIDLRLIADRRSEQPLGPLPADFLALPRPIVLAVGRLVAQKDHETLLKAFAAAREEFRGSLVLLGEGPLRGDLERSVSALGLTGRVWMPGFVDNPWWFMARADLFVLTSTYEGFGNVLVEALACGVPVISTDCPSGPREILQGRVGAELVKVGDVDALAESIKALTPGLRLRPDGESLARFDVGEIASKYARCVSEVAVAHGRG